jgi:carbon monoxide dehydrogenase subunit G
MNFSGTEHFDCTQADLWARLTDMAFVSRTIPDVDKIERLGPTGFTCKVRPRFAFLTGSLELSFAIIESEPEKRLVVRSRGKGIGAAIVVDIEIHLLPTDSGTDLNWTGTIFSREGLLKPVSTALIQGAAERVIQNLWQKFRAAMQSG